MFWDNDRWSELEKIKLDMNNLLTGADRNYPGRSYPLVNIYDSKESIIMTAEMPGMAKEDVNIAFSDGRITLSGERSSSDKNKDLSCLRSERDLGKFEKSIRIPIKIEPDKISAALINGVMTITLPKAEEAKPKIIKIQTN